MKVWSRAGSKNSTTNSQRAKRRGESKKKRKCQRGDPEQASTSRLFPYEGCKLLPPPQGRKVLFSKLNPLNPSRTEREETEEVQGPTATWGASVGVLKKSKAEAATMHKYGPLSVVESLSHIFAKHHNQRPKETVYRCFRLRGGSVNAPSETRQHHIRSGGSRLALSKHTLAL